jgi:hypothetical protein
MMNVLKYTISYLLLFLMLLPAYNQSCMGFYRNPRCYVKEAKGFKPYGQSKSAAIEVNKKYKFQVVLYGQKDFIFSLCTEPGFSPLHYKLTDNQTNEVIYDNEQDDYNQYVGFAMDKTTTVNVEVEIIMEAGDNEDPMKARVCLGVQIFWRHIPKLGFD